MNKLFLLIGQEFVIQNRINNIIKYLVIYFIFCIISTILINNHEDIKKFGLVFSVICLLNSLLNYSTILFKSDLKDGTLELLLSNFTTEKIILAKFFAILASSVISIILTIPIIYIFLDLNLLEVIYFFVSLCFLLILTSSLVVLVSSMQIYLKSQANFLGAFVMPILAPNVIMMGLILQNHNIKLVFIMFGINLIFLPIILFLSIYLIKNTYNF